MQSRGGSKGSWKVMAWSGCTCNVGCTGGPSGDIVGFNQ